MFTMDSPKFVFLVLLTSLCCITAQWNTKDYLKKEHSLVKPYSASGTHLSMWDFTGSTMVTNNFIRLTPDRQSKQGAIWNSLPCPVRNWEMQVHFNVHGSGRDLFGDGMALWYTKERMILGPVFGNMDYYNGLAIFLDTYANQNGPHNHKHPYVSAMVNNGSLHYDHDRDGTHTEIAGCEAKLRNIVHDTSISVKYTDNTVTVMLDTDGKLAWKECFKVHGIRLPTGYYFGASAGTGQLADNHDIISIKLYELDVDGDIKEDIDYSKIEPQADIFAPPRDHVHDSSTGNFRNKAVKGMKLVAIVFCAVLGLMVCGVVGFLMYQRSRDNKRKRFY